MEAKARRSCENKIFFLDSIQLALSYTHLWVFMARLRENSDATESGRDLDTPRIDQKPARFSYFFGGHKIKPVRCTYV